MAKNDSKSGAGCAAIFLLILAVAAAWFAWPLLIAIGVALGVAVAIKRAAAPTSKQAMPSTTRRNLIILAVLVGVLAIPGEVAWGVFLANHGKSNNNAGTTQDVGAGSPDVPAGVSSNPPHGNPSVTDLGAEDVCEKFVKQELKAPGTATFRDPTANNGDTTFSNDGDTYTVVSSVDAENSFGAKLRSGYTCVVTKLSGDQWQRVSVSLDNAFG